jgi:hypothetical protein
MHILRGAKSPSPFQLTVSPKDEGLTREDPSLKIQIRSTFC